MCQTSSVLISPINPDRSRMFNEWSNAFVCDRQHLPRHARCSTLTTSARCKHSKAIAGACLTDICDDTGFALKCLRLGEDRSMKHHISRSMCQGVISALASETRYASIEKVLAEEPINTRADLRKRLIFWKAADRL